jgi:hypothetical protein
MARPDFGLHETEHQGIKLTCRNIAPGLTLHDLTMIFERATKQANPGDEYAANPAKWPTVRGVQAVTDAILDAVYGVDEQLTNKEA